MTKAKIPLCYDTEGFITCMQAAGRLKGTNHQKPLLQAVVNIGNLVWTIRCAFQQREMYVLGR
jgi:hypothetical protein